MGMLNSLFFLPASFTLSYMWNFGSMLFVMLMSQIVTGFFLTFYYTSGDAFSSVQYIMFEVNFGWLLRIIHSNGASMFFLFIYFHIFKGLIYGSYRLVLVWLSGVFIYFFLMGIAFTGYVLIWGQMSYWAAVVITSLMTSVPYLGKYLVWWIWGSFSVCDNTLKFFYSVHFILPWFLLILIVFHLFFLHFTGSSSSIYCHGDYDKIHFFPSFWFKDGFDILFYLLFILFSLYFSFNLSDPMIFVESDSMASPAHVVPEWYFLFAFTILRSVPNKLFGVVLMFGSVFILVFLIWPGSYFSILDNFLYFFVMCFVWVFFWLTWAGHYPTDYPFNYFNLFCTFFYFFFILVICLINYMGFKIFS
uniref:Cytochrome b n=1 Tax=Dirofilaria sp. 'hongkongensis' TaxID=1255173 RepID=A0A1C9JA15_9BILA|nr:cytochrome b [Dirofilaria sp. 'hongkongensis']AOP18682.1 cytochrome b [Dirofilaria sp. 'hongkongensis']